MGELEKSAYEKNHVNWQCWVCYFTFVICYCYLLHDEKVICYCYLLHFFKSNLLLLLFGFESNLLHFCYFTKSCLQTDATPHNSILDFVFKIRTQLYYKNQRVITNQSNGEDL